MSVPLSVSMSDFDIDLLDWLTRAIDSPNRSATLHTCLVEWARRNAAPDALVSKAVRERNWVGSRRRVRPGTRALRLAVADQADAKAK